MIVSNIDTAMKALAEQVDILKKKAEEVIPVPMPIERVKTGYIIPPAYQKYSVSHFTSRYIDCTTEEHVDSKLTSLRRQYDEEIARIESVHAANQSAITNNLLVIQKVRELMQSVGIRPTKYTTINEGKRNEKTVEVKAGYIEDLERCVVLDDGYKNAVSSLKEAMDWNTRQANEVKIAIRKKLAEKEKAEKEKTSALLLAHMQVKYGLECTASWKDVLTVILSKDKYLRLAHAMCVTRGDWSDGFYRVEDALDSFDVETERDRAVFNTVQEILDGDESDGRVFRDCEYNYDVLYDMVDEALLKDYNAVNQHVFE